MHSGSSLRPEFVEKDLQWMNVAKEHEYLMMLFCLCLKKRENCGLI